MQQQEGLKMTNKKIIVEMTGASLSAAMNKSRTRGLVKEQYSVDNSEIIFSNSP